MIYLQLFLSYLKIGFFGFGGGYAMLSLIQNEVVVQNGWMSNAEFADIVAISQMTPGPIAINSATYVGYTVAGFWGSVVATVAADTAAASEISEIWATFSAASSAVRSAAVLRVVPALSGATTCWPASR